MYDILTFDNMNVFNKVKDNKIESTDNTNTLSLLRDKQDVSEITPKQYDDIIKEMETLIDNSVISIPIDFLKKTTRELTNKTLLNKEEQFIQERKDLLKKEYSQELTKSEKIKFNLLSWFLDRIEDAQNGEFLDKFEVLVKNQERIANNVKSNIDVINKMVIDFSNK